VMNGNSKTKKYKCVFFDLDHTLWDYETNSKETLNELFISYNLAEKGVTSADHFYQQFKKINFELWDLYDRELINHDYIRIERFKQILGHFNAYEEKLSTEISVEYLRTCPAKANLMPHAIETLEYLVPNYKLTVVTNGFEEIQNIKLTSGKISHYFDHIVTSQKAGCRKPGKQIFKYAMEANVANSSEVIMIGDNLITDIGGAKASSIDTVFFNPDKVKHNEHISYEIASLAELQKIL
jgi:YjjG family noncanonical pyrimidine nucleotidase